MKRQNLMRKSKKQLEAAPVKSGRRPAPAAETSASKQWNDEPVRKPVFTDEAEANPLGRHKLDLDLDSESNPYTLYLREIGQTRLITPQEEVVLAKRIQKGDEAAREQMIKANLRLVVKIAREYEDYGVPLL